MYLRRHQCEGEAERGGGQRGRGEGEEVTLKKECVARLQGGLKNQVRLRDGRDWEVLSRGGPGCDLCSRRISVCGDP